MDQGGDRSGDFAWHRAAAGRVVGFAAAALAEFESRSPVEDELQRVAQETAGAFLATGLHYTQAALLLAEADFGGPSLALSRTVIELDIDIAYILLSREDPTALAEVLKRFWALFEVAHLDRLQLAKNLRLDAFSAAPAGSLKRRKELLAEHPTLNERRWATHNIEERARRTKRVSSYRWAYDVASGAVHSGPEALHHATVASKTAGIATTSIALVAAGMAQLTQEVSNYLLLDFGSRCREVLEQVRDHVQRDKSQNGTSSG